MRSKILLLFGLMMFAQIHRAEAQNSDVHQNTRNIVGSAAVVGAGIFIYQSFKNLPSSNASVDTTVSPKGELTKTLRSSRRATALALGAGVLGAVFLNSGNVPLALVFSGVSAVSGIVAVVQKVNWENQVTRKLESL